MNSFNNLKCYVDIKDYFKNYSFVNNNGLQNEMKKCR
jgi:hypothetical protein